MVKVVTIFDSKYASLAFAMIESVHKNLTADLLFDIYPLDSEMWDSLDLFCKSKNIKYELKDSFFHKTEIINRKKSRDYSNYIFSLTPSILLNSADNNDCDLMIYLDADTYFFEKIDLDIFYKNKSPIHLIPHEFDGANKHLNKFGRINVGWLSFKPKDPEAYKFLQWWNEKCIESTETTEESLQDGVFGDQLYLDSASKIFNVDEISLSKINVAPWNYLTYHVRNSFFRAKMFHFHHLFRDKYFYYLPSVYYKRLTKKNEKKLYMTYLAKVNSIQKEYKLDVSLANSRRGSSIIRKLILFCLRETILVSRFD